MSSDAKVIYELLIYFSSSGQILEFLKFWEYEPFARRARVVQTWKGQRVSGPFG